MDRKTVDQSGDGDGEDIQAEALRALCATRVFFFFLLGYGVGDGLTRRQSESQCRDNDEMHEPDQHLGMYVYANKHSYISNLIINK